MKFDALYDRLSREFPRWSPMLYKAMLVSFFALAFIVPLGMVALPFVEFFNGMAAQPKGKTQMTYGRVRGEESLVGRLPVEGTVPRGYRTPPFADKANTIEDAKVVGIESDNPLPRTMDNFRAGQDLYNVYCIVCHGKEGHGDGPVTGPDRFPAPPSLHTEQARGYRDGTIWHVIGKGTEKMPGYADKLDPHDRWKVVHYLRALQRAMNPKPEDLEP